MAGVFDRGNKFHVETLFEDLLEKLHELVGSNTGVKLYGPAGLGRVEKERRKSPYPILKSDSVFATPGFRVKIDLDLVLQHIPDEG